jgi:hypothetical protein
MTKGQFETKLEDKGFPVIGKGMYAKVFAIPNTDKAIKVAYLDAWPKYIEWSTKNGHAGKFAPKVESLKFFDGFYVAVMEKLVATISEFPGTSEQRQFYREMTGYGTKTATDLAEFWNSLRHEGMSGDLHGGNVMVRKDGQIVVTDPTSRAFDTERFRIKRGELQQL